MNMETDIDFKDLMDTDQEEDSKVDEESSTEDSGSDVSDGQPDETEQDEENLNDEQSDDEESDEDDESEEDDGVEDDEDDESEEDEDSEQEDGDKPRRNRRAERRINKLNAKIKARDAIISEREKELSELKDRLLALDASGGQVFTSESEILERRKVVVRQLDEIEEAIEEGGYTTKDGREIDTKTLRAWKREARRELDEALPAAQRRVERQREINREVVAKSYPLLLDEDSKDAKEAKAFLDKHPSLKSEPEALLIAGDFLRGRRLRTKTPGKKSAPKKGGKVSRQPPERKAGGQAPRSVRTPQPKNEDKELLEGISQLLP